jgi:hypothetical protein
MDAITLLFQFLLVEVAAASLFMWTNQWDLFGSPDVTIHWWTYTNRWASQEMAMYQGIGIHWSTLFWFSFGALNLSFFLRQRLKINGVHNVAYSMIVGYWVAAMVFEIPYVFAMDLFHNGGDPTGFPIWLSGWNVIKLGATGQAGVEAPRWIAVSMILYPTTVAISVLLAFRHYGNSLISKFGFSRTKTILYVAFISSFIGAMVASLWFCLNVGIFPVIIRNWGWLLGIIMAYVILLDALQNPSSPSYMGDNISIGFRFTEKKTLLFISLFVVGFIMWVIYPITPLNTIYPAQFVKGTEWFPQTVYAFYQTDVPIIRDQIWIGNLGVFIMNHLIVKPLATLVAVYGFAPKIKRVKS